MGITLMATEKTEETIMTMVAPIMAGMPIMMAGTIITTTASIMTEETTLMVEENMDETIITMLALMMAGERVTMITITALIMAEETILMAEEKMITSASMMVDKIVLLLMSLIVIIGDRMANTLGKDKEV